MKTKPNPVPRGKWMRGRVKVTRSGKILFSASKPKRNSKPKRKAAKRTAAKRKNTKRRTRIAKRKK
jgi:hypothetical protein